MVVELVDVLLLAGVLVFVTVYLILFVFIEVKVLVLETTDDAVEVAEIVPVFVDLAVLVVLTDEVPDFDDVDVDVIVGVFICELVRLELTVAEGDPDCVLVGFVVEVCGGLPV